MNFFWHKTYEVKCRDGSVKTVYRNIDLAFPLYIPGWKGSISGVANVNEIADATIKGEYISTVRGLLFALDKLNQGLMLNFRAAYIVYKSDPCLNAEFLQREVSKLINKQSQLISWKAQIDGLLQLAASFPNDSKKFKKMYEKIIENMNYRDRPSLSKERISEAERIAKSLIGESSQ